MVRAIYRWRVKSGKEEKFIQAWTQGTAAIRAKVIGAGGSLLMRSHHDRSEFMALACWNSIEDWQAFAAENDSASPDPEAFRVMVGSSRVDLQACKLEYSIVSPK